MFTTIALCDANRDFRDYLSKQIHSLALPYMTKMNVHPFVNADAMMSAVTQWKEYDALFLEIGKNTSENFELAKKLRSEYEHLAIIFMAEDVSYALQGYDVPLFRYLLRDDIDAQLQECLQSLMKKLYIPLNQSS